MSKARRNVAATGVCIKYYAKVIYVSKHNVYITPKFIFHCKKISRNDIAAPIILEFLGKIYIRSNNINEIPVFLEWWAIFSIKALMTILFSVDFDRRRALINLCVFINYAGIFHCNRMKQKNRILMPNSVLQKSSLLPYWKTWF